MQVRSSPPPPPPQWLAAPQTCCFALFPSAAPVVWCGAVLHCSPPPPHPPPCGVVWCGCARYCSSSDISGIIIIIIINGWYPLKPAVLRGSMTPPAVVWCGWPPPCTPVHRGVVWLCPRPGPAAAATWEKCGTYSRRGGATPAVAGEGSWLGGGGYHWGGGGVGEPGTGIIYIYISICVCVYVYIYIYLYL